MVVAEVEPQPVRRVQAAPLRDVIAKGPAQRLVQQVRAEWFARIATGGRDRPTAAPLATADGAIVTSA